MSDSPLLSYLRRRCSLFGSSLDWLARELQGLGITSSHHTPVFRELDGVLAEARNQLRQLKLIVDDGHPWFVRRGLPIIHDIECTIGLLACQYLPALSREDTRDRFLGRVLLRACERVGLDWVNDVVVRLDAPCACWPVPTSIPLFFGPQNQSATILDLPGFYHEFGHIVFEKFGQIRTRLATVVEDYFSKLESSAGPQDPASRTAREGDIRAAVEYWGPSRLNEVFSDVFGSFAAGPAHYASLVDLAMRGSHDAYYVDQGDEHPPLFARVMTSRLALYQNYQAVESIAKIESAWRDHLGERGPSSSYSLRCSEALLRALVNEGRRCIFDFMSSAKEYRRPLGELKPGNTYSAEMELEDLVNAALMVLLVSPEKYSQWELRQLGPH